MSFRNGFVCAGALAVSLLAVAPALAHQTAHDNGVAVTMHVSPDDEPVAGRQATVNIVKVDLPGSRRFSWKRGRPALRITDSSGNVLRRGHAGKHTKFTFPRSGAYELKFSGRFKRGGKRRSFSTRFAIRAS